MNSRKKIIVLNSPLFRVKNPLYDEDSLPPIGLGLIATELKSQEFDVELIDAVALNLSIDELVSIISLKKPDFICTNVFTTNFQLVKDLVETIQIKAHFVIGGLSTKDLYNEIFSWQTNNPIDIIHGDGEKIITDIILNTLKECPISYNENRQYFTIDTLSMYYVKDISDENLDRSFFSNEPTHHPLGFTEANIVTSRGCIYNCAFCAAANSINRSLGIREKSSMSISSEIQHLVNIYPGLQSIRILDDLFLKNSQTIDKAIDIFKNYNLQWRSMAHIETFRNISDEKIKSLKLSGCKELFIGIESGSPRILKQIHKTHDIEKIKANISLLLRNGINVKGYFIFGFPEETEADFKMTYELAHYLKDESVKYKTVFRTSVFQYRPYHGTELYKSIKDYEKHFVNKILPTIPNPALSGLIGRLQFNFHSGNYSCAEIQVVQDYIYKTSNLNTLCIFGLDDEPKNNFKYNY